MRIVIADAGPLNYLILAGIDDALPRLFNKVILPQEVHDELRHAKAPVPVRDWAGRLPDWVEIKPVQERIAGWPKLHPGERAAIALGIQLRADLLLMDDRAGVAAAHHFKLNVIGTVGVLDMAARQHLIQIDAVVARLKETNFRCPAKLLDELLEQYRKPQMF